MKILQGITYVLFTLAIAAVVSMLLAFPTKWAINYVFSSEALYATFGGPLTLGKAWALSFLASWIQGSGSSKESK